MATSTPSSAASLEGILTLQTPPIYSENAEKLKARLRALGYEICAAPGEQVSGWFTAQTESAVRHFQAVNGLTVDGVVDAHTWERLFSDAAAPAPSLQVRELAFSQPVLGGLIAQGLASDGSRLWLFSPGFGVVDVFDPQTEDKLVAMYSISALPGEEEYELSALAFDGTRLWAASQGDRDAIVQTFDPTTSPIVGVLSPMLGESIHIDDVLFVRAMTFDGQRIWVAVEGFKTPSGLVPIDPLTGTAGQRIEFGIEEFVGAPASDGERLWVALGGMFGDWAVRPVDPVTGMIGEPLGVCGFQLAYDGQWLWVAREGALVAVDPDTGQAVATAPFNDGHVYAMTFDGQYLWILGSNGSVRFLDVR